MNKLIYKKYNGTYNILLFEFNSEVDNFIPYLTL